MYDIDFKNLKKGKGFGMTFFGFGLFFFCMMFGMIINIFFFVYLLDCVDYCVPGSVVVTKCL